MFRSTNSYLCHRQPQLMIQCLASKWARIDFTQMGRTDGLVESRGSLREFKEKGLL